MKCKIYLIFVCLFGISNSYSQPIYPGSLTIVFTNENDTLTLKNLDALNNGYIEFIAYNQSDTFKINIYRPIIEVGNENFRQYCILNTGLSNGEYVITKIEILNDKNDTMIIRFNNAQNTSNYFLDISFRKGEYILDIEKLEKEHYDEVFKIIDIECKKLFNEIDIIDCEKETLKNKLFFDSGKNFGAKKLKSRIVTPLNWTEFKN